MIISAFVLGYFTRVSTDVVVYAWNFPDYFRFTLAMTFFWLIIFAIVGLYKKYMIRLGALDLLAQVFLSASAGIMLVVAYLFLSRTEFFSRLVILYTWGYAIIFIFIARLIIKIIYQELLKHGIGIHRVIVIGKSSAYKEVVSAINSNKSFGLKIVKVIDKDGVSNLDSISSKVAFDEIIIADSSMDEKEVAQLVDYCQERGKTVRLVPNLFRVRSANMSIETISGIPMVEFKVTPLEGWGSVAKRIMDISISLLMLVILSPIFLVIAILIKITSPGPILFQQTRVGSRNKQFKFLKFRSMITGAEKSHEKMIEEYGNMFKLKNDPRVTPFGRFLRITSLDELPQFYNVLKGEMSLVGPRPAMPEEVKYYQPAQKKRLGIKPGITGLWQVSGRSELDFMEWVRLDVYYIENWSLWLDIKILLKTIYVVCKRNGAY
jgi:exopolysaccharide biosynthesis polyprenyl glycosylphosphotransferase